MKLRPYQQDAINCAYQYLRGHDDNPVIVIPTGGGKTLVIAKICKDAVSQWDGRVLIIAHVKELLEQAADKLNTICPEIKAGLYSAGLKRRDIKNDVIIGGIQSIFKRACDLGAFNLIIIDEAHLIPPDGEGMYRKFLKDAFILNPKLRIVGLTATPFRMKSGVLCAPGNILNNICYEVGVKEMIVNGYLCPLVSKAGKQKVDVSELHVRAGEFIAAEADALMNTEQLVRASCREIIDQTYEERKSILIFCTSVAHAERVYVEMKFTHITKVAKIFGDTPAKDRDQILKDFKKGKIQYLVNVSVLTTGFDAPSIDCVVLLRPTLSPGLFYQMCGRGFRLNPGKKDCLILDFGSNVQRHGCIDQIRVAEDFGPRKKVVAPTKECPECHTFVAMGYQVCPYCEYKFPPPEKQEHNPNASTDSVISGEVSLNEFEVNSFHCSVHTKKGADESAPKTMKVTYYSGLTTFNSEWICFEHEGWAKKKAESWWKLRSNADVPKTTAQAVNLANNKALCDTKKIKVKSVSGEKFNSIVGYELGKKPEWDEKVAYVAKMFDATYVDIDDVPF